MYKKSVFSWLKHWDFMLLDFIVMQLSLMTAYAIFKGTLVYTSDVYRIVALSLFVSQFLVVFFLQTFKNILKRGYYLEFVAAFKHIIGVVLVDLAMLFFLHYSGLFSRKIYITMVAIYFVLSYLARIGHKNFLYKTNKVTEGNRSVVIISTSGMVDSIVENFSLPQFHNFKIVGVHIMDEVAPFKSFGDIPVLGADDDVLDFICHGWVDEVFIRVPEDFAVPKKLTDELITMGITVHNCIITPDDFGTAYVERFGNYTVLTNSVKMVTYQQMFYKRVLDIIGGIVGCLITLIIFIFIAPIIFIKSPGPIFFKQTRIGRNGKKFKMYKFRSMYMDAEERKKEYMAQNKMDGLMFKMDDDPRIIGSEKKGKDGKPKGIGNFIRNTSLDEFPQFFNVLKGDMSLVGTRPPTVDEWEQYDLKHRVRMSIKPGITGLWQISGRSKITDFDEVVRLDSEYIQNWDLGSDIKIILKTVVVVLKRDGAE
ncbi:MAG: sugar transferase [Acutalibacteraceae bacterium]|nr:sugar transferase [Clostridia bacterium]MBQ1528972.1 sugar transferase [Clostridia bacterium]MBQ5580551.1 sugar transferase [Clostridia bacterium]MBR1826116.1 sugar transferase [Clostridia bacterium]MEE3374216.1 sugar transferase [Acutalibacteraceae bacterium]